MRTNITVPVDEKTKQILEALANDKEVLLARYVREVLHDHIRNIKERQNKLADVKLVTREEVSAKMLEEWNDD